MADEGSKFTFLNYDSPDHNASHRKKVKAHISSKYRTTVRKDSEPRYALPQRLLYPSQPADDPGDESGNGSAGSARKKKKQRLDLELRRRLPSPLEVGFTGTRVDPFTRLPGQETPCVLNAVDYYAHVLSPLYKPMLLALNVVNPVLDWTFPLFLKHEDAFHAVIAVAQTYMERSRAPTSVPSKEVQFHRWKAASVLRAKLAQLQGPPDDAAIMTVLGLACLDVLFHDPGTINRDGLGLMVAMRGGLNNLGLHGMIKAYLVQFDYFWMLETNSSTMFPFSRRKEHRIYPQHPFSSDLNTLINTIPPGFRAVAFQNTLGVDVLQILSRVSKYVESKSSGYASVTEGSPVVEGQEYPDIFDACSCLHSSPSTEHSLEKNLCLAVILLSFNVYSPAIKGLDNLAPYRGSRQELTRSLPASEFKTPEERNCLIWIWMVVVESWYVDGALAREGLLLSVAFFNKFDEAGSWDRIEMVMRQFFWDEQLARVWRQCWQEAFDDYQLRLASRESITAGEGSTAEETSESDIPEGRRPDTVPSEGAHQIREQVGTATIPPMLTLETFIGQLH